VTKADVESMLVEVRDGVRVLRNEAVETRRVLKLLVGVLNDIQVTTEGLRQELHHIRTARERADRAAVALAALEAVKPTPEAP
jgi:hypothetical protein